MNELQLSLLGIGVLVIAGVIVYNRLQEARLRRKSEEAFGSRHEDVLLGAQGALRRADGSADRIEPVLSEASGRTSPAGSTLDPGIDFIATLQAHELVTGEAISAAIVDSLDRPAKTVTWEGYSRQTTTWEPLGAAGEYETLRAGLQLVDRKGAASQKDLSDFSTMVQAVAEAIGASCTLPEPAVALERAQRLDALCADVDVQIGLNLVARGSSFAGTKIRAFAEAHGLVLEAGGRFCRRDDAGLELYSLCNAELPAFSAEGMKTLATRGLTLLFDVARAPGGIAAFDRYAELARVLAETLSAGIVDDNRRPLDEAGLNRIRAQLQALYASMEQQGISAGSQLALRLFS
jgi:FtsZ-interacting cell division protein ZipA